MCVSQCCERCITCWLEVKQVFKVETFTTYLALPIALSFSLTLTFALALAFALSKLAIELILDVTDVVLNECRCRREWDHRESNEEEA